MKPFVWRRGGERIMIPEDIQESLGLRFRSWPVAQPKALRGVLIVAATAFLAAGMLMAPLSRADGGITLREGWTVESSAKVNAGGESVSTPGFDASAWYKTSAPSTVFAVLVENGVYKDPYFGMNLRSVPGVSYTIGSQFANQEMPADSPYAVPWWYRREFEVPAQFSGKTIWLAFRGINYRAEIWINGKKLAGSDLVVGAFRRYEFDVTSFVKTGAKNVVAVEVSAPHANELGITWVDWNPTPPDKDMGLWQEVVLSASGPVSVRHPAVETKLDLPETDKAHLTVRAELQNASNATVKGFLRGTISDVNGYMGLNPSNFSRSIELKPGERRAVAIAPDQAAALNMQNPRLWWPYQMGNPYLYTLELEFIPENRPVSDKQTIKFGIVQTDSELTPEGYRLFKVNGKPVLVRGGGWAPDMMLRINQSRREAEFRYVKEMGLNTIRLEGKLEDESFLERADRDGILIMAGWCCCDAWEKWGKWGDENRRVSVDSLRDQILRLRAHPSLLVWLNGSDNPPPPDRERAYLDVEKEANWPKPVISSATGKKTEPTGDSGVKMSGPYEYVSSNYWLLDTKAGGAYGFNTETSPGPAVPPLEELKSMFPPDKLWPINEVWDFHAGGGKFKNIKVFTNALEKRYGIAKDVSDLAWKSQAMTYEGQRAMFEAYGRNKYKSTGIIQWMLNNAWNGLIWHLYDYDLRPAGGYFGSKKALEPVHVQFSYDDRTVAIVNGKQEALTSLKVAAKIYDTAMKERFSHEEVSGVSADGVSKVFSIPEPDGITPTYFLNLQLYSPSGELLSRNFYWLSAKQDVPDFAKTEWYYTPLTEYADFAALQDLPKATLNASWKVSNAGADTTAHITLENTGSGLAFLVRLRILKGKDGAEVLPVFWDDNYISLLPGEKREITVKVRKTDLGGAAPVSAIDGFNVAPVQLQ
ncbi:MAG TPA: glycoside hydrolase family 2 protein [Candidatus Acidoferrum sp.]|nr:glycoside hydrolase family 2 protein [Candidatus Acidoferrum sp.]